MERLLTGWNHICSVLINSKDIQELQIKDTNLNEPAFSVLYNSLKYRNCMLKVLVANNLSFLCEKHLFFELIQNCNLQHLNLSLTVLSPNDVKLLCDVLNQAEGNIEKLVVASCKISPDDCKMFASILINSKTLKRLNLASNTLKKGISSLCKSLCHPDCILEHLVLEACELTGACCEDLASIFTQCKTLWGINLLENTLDYNGLVVLCKALKQQQTCTPYVLGLRITDFDNETQAFLIAEQEKNPCLCILSSV